MFDIHRDGIPDPNFYYKEIGGKKVAQMRLVVGRQNPKMDANKEFAKRLMAYSNKKHPNIVKEIFIARGNFNQDLLPTVILVEAGTYTNSQESAEGGVAMLADAVPAVVNVDYIRGGNTETGAYGFKLAAWILGIAVVGRCIFIDKCWWISCSS
jgi:stage II sporulation protein P